MHFSFTLLKCTHSSASKHTCKQWKQITRHQTQTFMHTLDLDRDSRVAVLPTDWVH